MVDFVPGLDLSRRFYTEVVRKLIGRPHAAALVGEGSEVLGFDQPRSTDHAWGPRLQIFVATDDVEPVSRAIEAALPEAFAGWPIRFFSWQTNSVRHHVDVSTLPDWLSRQIGSADVDDLSTAAWLALPQQSLLQVTQGAVFHDDTGDLYRVRQLLAQYPRDVWLWMMASQWHLIGNTEPLVGRTVEASDARGGVLIAVKLMRLLMELCFLQDRRYWPYRKWFGTAFARLPAATTAAPLIDAVLATTDERERQGAVAAALRHMAERHNQLGVTPPIDPSTGPFHVGINDAVRPYEVLNAGRFVEACKQAIDDDGLRKLATVGAIDQLTYGDDLLVNFTDWPQWLRQDYQAMIDRAAGEQ